MDILLVDDSKMMRKIQRNILGNLAASVVFVEADDGIQALDAIAAKPGGFDLILIDWNMPNMDGITLVDRIRATDRKTPLLMVTTEAEKSRILDAIKAGVNNYALKPFTPESLLDKARQILVRKAA